MKSFNITRRLSAARTRASRSSASISVSGGATPARVSFVIDSRADRDGRLVLFRANSGVGAENSTGVGDDSTPGGVCDGEAAGVGDSLGDSFGIGEAEGVSAGVCAGEA